MNVSIPQILLVDDDAEDAFLFRLALDEAHVNAFVTHIEDVKALAAALAGKPPDFIFLDMQMPCADGITCLSMIRQVWSPQQIPVIIYSGVEHAEAINQCLKGGANFFISKSKTIQLLGESIRRVLMGDYKDNNAA